MRPLGIPAQRLLAYLALNAGRTVTKADAARKVWGHGGEESLRKALKDLRDVLEDAGTPFVYLETVAGARGRHGTIRLRADQLWVDALEFESLQATAPAEALILYRGDLLGPIRYPGEWLAAQRTRFQRLAAGAHGLLAEQDWHAGRPAEAILHAERRLEISRADVGALRILAGYVAEHRSRDDAIAFVERYLADRNLDAGEQNRVAEIIDGLRGTPPAPGPVVGGVAPALDPARATNDEPPPGRTRTKALALGATGAITAAVALALAAWAGIGAPGPSSADTPCDPAITASSVADADVATSGAELRGPLTALRTVDVGARPTVVAVGHEGVWVGQATGIVLIDPATETQLGSAIPTESGVFALALSKDRVWATLRDGSMVSIDRDTGRLTGPPIEFATGPGDVAVGAGSVWANNFGDEATEGMVTRVEPCSGTFHRIPVGRSAATVRFGHGSVWITDPVGGAVARLNPRTEEVVRIPGLADPEDLIVADDAVWVVQYARQSIVRIDPRTNLVAGPEIRVGPDPGGITAGSGLLWLPLYGNGSLTRVEESSGNADPGLVQVGTSPTDAAVGFGRLWVANNGADTVTVIGGASPAG